LSVGGGPRFYSIAHACRPPRRAGIKAGQLDGNAHATITEQCGFLDLQKNELAKM